MLLADLSEHLHSCAFRDAHRVNPSDFTRKRCLDLPTLVGFMLQHSGNQSVQASLDRFFTSLGGHAHAVRGATKSALCQARRKLKASALHALNRLWVDGWHAQGSYARWHGLRVVAADGTCLRLPRWDENVQVFGPGPYNDGSVVMARSVALMSVATGQFLDVRLGAYEQGERALLMGALDALRADDVMVWDRGYPAWWLFAALQARKVNFCARIDACGWPDVVRLLRSSAREIVLTHRLRPDTRRAVLALGLPCPETIELRLVKVLLPNGHIEVLATSLVDTERYRADTFSALYAKRWAIEEAFKTIKHRLHIEGWSGELPHTIEQDVAAKILMHNITEALCEKAQQALASDIASKSRVNHAYALMHLPQVVATWIGGDAGALSQVLHAAVSLIGRTRDKIRPGRSFQRKHKVGAAQRPRKAYR
ncbi:IS4 family transposase [Pseudorhodoferax sp.]|uniref:IS4 family transposase n=1 Tax=Pseudorhodoferax sp. TaxID=1993553 RepID=UPI0039E48834